MFVVSVGSGLRTALPSSLAPIVSSGGLLSLARPAQFMISWVEITANAAAVVAAVVAAPLATLPTSVFSPEIANQVVQRRKLPKVVL